MKHLHDNFLLKLQISFLNCKYTTNIIQPKFPNTLVNSQNLIEINLKLEIVCKNVII